MRESAFSICRKGVLRDVFPRVGKVDGTCRVGLSHVWENGEGRAASRCLRSIQKKRARKHGVLASLYFCMEAEPHCVPSPLSPLLDRFWGRDPGVKVSAPWHCRAAWHSLNQHLFAVSDIHSFLGHSIQLPSLQVIYGGLSIICSRATCRLRPDLRLPPGSVSCGCYYIR